MSLEGFRPKAAFEEFRQSIPRNRVGFRFESHEYAQTSLQRGIRFRHFYVFDLNAPWDQIKKKRREVEMEWQVLSRYGGRDGNWDIPWRFKNPNEALSHYEQHPEDYKSVLLLNFSGPIGWLLSRQTFMMGYSQNFVPSPFVKAEIHLEPEDYQKVRDVLSKDKDNLEGGSFQHRLRMEKMLTRRLLKRFIRSAIKPEQT